MKIKVLNQSRDRLCAVKEITLSRGDNKYRLSATDIDGCIVSLGVYKSGLTAEKVLVNIIRRYNMNPELIMIIPEDMDTSFWCLFYYNG